MAFQIKDLHFILIPLMSQSYLIPMTDLAKLLARHGVTVSIITTPLNATRLQPTIDRSNLKIQLIRVPFPSQQAGLPQGCENLDALTSQDLLQQFFMATYLLQEPVEKLVAALQPRPSCIVTTNALPWTSRVALNLDIPRFLFQHISTFAISCAHRIFFSGADESAASDTEPFLVPGVPDTVRISRAQLPDVVRRNSDNMKGTMEQIKEAEFSAQGVLVNSFDELEGRYADVYQEFVKKVWCVGPVSLCNKETLDKFERGNKASIDEHYCLKWLDSMAPGSVLYACFGSLCHIPAPQLIELALGLESSNRPFIWIIREQDDSAEIGKWIEEEDFEGRNKGKGLVIRGWAPQVMILSHPSVGGFLTHCGWNSVMESVCAGAPMITWPMFAEQFYNEKLIVDVLKIGVGIGVDVSMKWAQEQKMGMLVKREHVKKAVDKLMSDGEEAKERRKRARELAEVAKRATEEGGSSHLNMTLFIRDVLRQVLQKNSLQEYGPCSPVTSSSSSLPVIFKSGQAAS